MNHWLDIIGVTELGISALPPAQIVRLNNAKNIISPSRFLPQLDARNDQKHVIWNPPLTNMLAQIEKLRSQPTVILASGDPTWFGIGATLTQHFEPEEFTIHPALSSFQLAAAILHWPLQNIQTLSFHGRNVASLHPHILPDNRILALTANAKTLVEIANLLLARAYSHSDLHVLENLGGANQRLVSFPVTEAKEHHIGDFYVLGIECRPDQNALLLPTTPGLPDQVFKNDGQLTKSHVRAATLAALAPFPGALLWDVGAGCGSVAIEWMRAANNARAICFERNQNRVDTITHNANVLGVPDLTVEPGTAPDSLANMDQPDAIFIGGAVADEDVFQTCWQALKPGGRLVANAVTLAGQSALIQRQKQLGGDLTTIAISTLSAISSQSLLKPRLPVMQFVISKPHQEATQK